jgi:hypothetical protein
MNIYNGFIACSLMVECVGIGVPVRNTETFVLFTPRFHVIHALLYAAPYDMCNNVNVFENIFLTAIFY